jgi:hypothetical protein
LQPSCCTAAYEAASLTFKENRVTFYGPGGGALHLRHTHGFVIDVFINVAFVLRTAAKPLILAGDSRS